MTETNGLILIVEESLFIVSIIGCASSEQNTESKVVTGVIYTETT